MDIIVRQICSPKLKEVKISLLGMSMESGTLNEQEQIDLAMSFLEATEELLNDDKHQDQINQINAIIQSL